MNEITLKQPAGLKVLFFAEMWERFGFYCVQALLVLYLTQKLLWADKSAYALYSTFSALIYATPLIGGFLADKLLGYRQAIFIGTVLYLIGYFAMGSANPAIFNFALAALICGNGFFKANVSSLLGKLYEDNDPRRESGFTWFYMGINIGSFLAPLICTYIAVRIGWHYAFMTAGVGMLFCLAICFFGFKNLGDKGIAPVQMKWKGMLLFYSLLALTIYGIDLLLNHEKFVNNLLIVLGMVAFSVLLFSAFFEDKLQRHKLIVLVILMVFSILFWALYFQIWSSLTLFTERNVNRTLFHITIPTGMFGSINPFFILALSPLLAVLWLKLNQSHSFFNPSVPMKFVFGLFLVGAGFLVLSLGIKLAGAAGMVAMGWLVFNYFLQTLGELSLSPIGLSAVTSLAPSRLSGMVMGLWFLSFSAAFAVGEKLADLTAVSKEQIKTAFTAPIYFTHFLQFGLMAVGVGLLLVLFSPYLRRLMVA